jgi:hypothetical protein
MARSSFSGAMLGRPPFTSAAYIAVNTGANCTSAVLAISRIVRSGCLAGTKSSSLRRVNRLSVKVSALRDVGRVLGMSYGHVDSIAKLIPRAPRQDGDAGRAAREAGRQDHLRLH